MSRPRASNENEGSPREEEGRAACAPYKLSAWGEMRQRKTKRSSEEAARLVALAETAYDDCDLDFAVRLLARAKLYKDMAAPLVCVNQHGGKPGVVHSTTGA